MIDDIRRLWTSVGPCSWCVQLRRREPGHQCQISAGDWQAGNKFARSPTPTPTPTQPVLARSAAARTSAEFLSAAAAAAYPQ